jgi:hypothetical protein
MSAGPSLNMFCVGTLHNVGEWNGVGWSDQGLLGGWTISSLAFAPDGITWCVGTLNNVGKWNGTGWSDQGLLGGWKISSLAFAPDGTMWCVGTLNNVGKWNGTGWSDQGLLGGWKISSLAFAPDGTMWCVGTLNNVGKWNGTGWSDQGLLGGWSISSLAWAPDGTMWCVGTLNNVGKWNGTGWSDQGLLGGWKISSLAWGNIQPFVKAATWMADMASLIGTRSLKDVVIPGTHDSGTYAITATSGIAPEQDIPQWVNAVYTLGLPGLVAGQVIAGWAKTQPLDIAGQLAAGIRYFDIRVVLSNGTYYMCHSMYSAPIDDLISAVNAFIRQNPKEVVILDFNHLYGMPDLAANDTLVKKLVNALGNKMAPSSLTPTSTFDDFWASGYQVVTLYAFDNILKQYPQIWSQSQISSPYPATADIGILHNDLDGYLARRSASQLFVLQGILTPDGAMIAKGVIPLSGTPGSIQSLAEQVTPTVVSWVQGWANLGLNIVIVDWFTAEPNYVDALLQINLNRK